MLGFSQRSADRKLLYSLHLEEGESWYAFNASVRLSVRHN
jgi:hypothetical protein